MIFSLRTLVVGRTARAAEAQAAHVGLVAVAVAVRHASARNRHGPVAVCARHCAGGGLVSQVARGSARDLRRGAGGEGRGGRVQLVGEGTVGVLRRGKIVVVGWWCMSIGGVVARVARGRKGRHTSSAGPYRSSALSNRPSGERIPQVRLRERD